MGMPLIFLSELAGEICHIRYNGEIVEAGVEDKDRYLDFRRGKGIAGKIDN